MEQTGEGFYARTRPTGFNHVAVWAPDDELDRALRAPRGSDLTVEATLYDQDGELLVAFFQSRVLGLRVELVPASRRESIAVGAG
jgi:hypothetical protein